MLLANLIRSRFGRTLRAVRDDEVAARLAGIPVARTQVLAFVVSAACAGLGGGMFAVLAQSVSPGAFALTLSLNLLLAVVVGGLGSLAGAVWGSLLLVLVSTGTVQATTATPTRLGYGAGDDWEPALASDKAGHVYALYAHYGGIQGCAACPSPVDNRCAVSRASKA